jgi:phytoene synthase
MHYQIDRAKDFYIKAFALLPKEDRFKQLPGLMMGNIYYDLLLRIEEGDLANILNERTQLTPIRKIWVIILTFINKYN